MIRNSKKLPILLFDIDGVINQSEMFSRRYANKHNIPLDVLAKFFDGVFQECIVGKADLRNELVHVLHEWKWGKSVDELLDYWFLDDVKYDQRVLDTIHKLKTQNVKVYCASNQEHHRARYLIESTNLKHYIDKFFLSGHLGVKKPDTRFFQNIIDALDVKPSEIVYWDDDENNVKSANKLGIQGYTYTNFSVFEKELSRYFQLK